MLCVRHPLLVCRMNTGWIKWDFKTERERLPRFFNFEIKKFTTFLKGRREDNKGGEGEARRREKRERRRGAEGRHDRQGYQRKYC